MKIRKILKVTAVVVLFTSFSFSYAVAQGFNTLSDCLVTNDIGKYTYKTKTAYLMNNGSGVVGNADHFDLDHADTLCDGGYSNINEARGLSKEEKFKILLSVKVQVTQHTGGDSDRWLLHELDRNFRNYYGMPSESYVMRVINGNTIMAVRSAGGRYQWISGNKVIQISYTDLQLTKPEPLEVVQTYLAKHPSSLTSMTSADLRTSQNKTKWIKDEMERRLWLCDKWNAQFQAGVVTQADLMPKLIENMTIFLNYRQKYYGVEAENDLNAFSGYLQNNDIASIQTKLSEYKAWWNANKGRGITLP